MIEMTLLNIHKIKIQIILIWLLVILPKLVLGSGNWKVIDTAGTEEPGAPAYICLVMPKKYTGGEIVFKDFMVMHRRGDTYPMVKFAAFDRGVYSFKYVIDHPNMSEQVREILPNRKGSLFINGPRAVEFIELLKKGNQIRYLIGSNTRTYDTQAISLLGFASTLNSINNCKK